MSALDLIFRGHLLLLRQVIKRLFSIKNNQKYQASFSFRIHLLGRVWVEDVFSDLDQSNLVLNFCGLQSPVFYIAMGTDSLQRKQQAHHQMTFHSFFNDLFLCSWNKSVKITSVSQGKKNIKVQQSQNLSKFTKNHKGVDKVLEYKQKVQYQLQTNAFKVFVFTDSFRYLM